MGKSTAKREKWVDYVKTIACILVVLGHLFMSMVEAEIIPESNFYDACISVLYYFHVPLFFICSGYLFQKYSYVRSFSSWKANVIKKFFSLGIPFFVFSALTWAMKTVFSSSINRQIDGFFRILFIKPTAPYWYLYTLFFIFLIAFSMKTKTDAVIWLLISLFMKFFILIQGGLGVVAIDSVMENMVWFAMGMALSQGLIKKCESFIATIMLVFFIVACYFYKSCGIHIIGVSFFLGAVACYSIISLVSATENRVENCKIFVWLSRYTMPIFLMHTLFAAPCRVALLKIGINNCIQHLAIGLIISFAGPVAAMKIMEKLKPLDFVVYPNRYLKFKK